MPDWALRFALGCCLVWAAPLAAAVDFAELAQTAPVERVRQTMDYFAGLGSRVVGYPGADAAARHLQERFREVGLDDITVHEYDVSIPIDKGGFLQVADSDEKVQLHGLWPNLVKTSTLPEGGIDGRLVDAGGGEYADMDGIDIEGAVALMDFNSGDAWLNAAYLGARAIVFIEPDSTVYLEGEKKFLTMPLDLPRFWVSRQAGERLRGQIAAAGELPVHLEYRMDWERRPAWNILGTIPGYDPLMKEDVIVLEGYYDAMSVVPALAPGAEQASSVTALLELARYFREHPPARTVIFLATSAHHLGLRGVDDFIQRYLRKEDPFIDHMLVRRVVEAALARNMIEKSGVRYAVGTDEFGSKEALVRHIADGDTSLVARIADAAIDEGLVARQGGQLALFDEVFAGRAELVAELRDDDDLRLALYKDWVDPKVDSLAVKLFISLDLSSQTDELGVWNSNSSFYYKRYFAPFGKNFMAYASKISRELGYQRRDVLVNGISPEGGMSW
ncbi:M28 family peptidase, partial [bacterium]|nr:M28 family peptidase [bacterium]